MDDDKAPEPRLLARRELLQIGAAGLAALGAASATPAGEGLQTPGSGQGARPPQPPAPETIANPATMLVEDWSEPWVWRPEEWPGQPLTLQIVGNRHLPRAVAPGNRYRAALQLQRREPGADDSHTRRCDAAREGAKHARPESRTGAERSDAGSVRDSARRSRGRALRDIEGPGYGMHHAADAGPRTPRRDLSLHSSHARGHELPYQSCKRAAWLAHDEPAHARRARPAGNECRMARKGTTRSFAFCRRVTGRSASVPARDAAARSKRMSASPKPTSSSRLATSWGHEPGAVARPSPILQARIGTTRTAMARHTIKLPAGSPASSSSKAMSTTRSTGR